MNRIVNLFVALVLSCTLAAPVFAQGGYEVKGVVVDQAGPVIGATVLEKGTTNGVSTGLDGDFVLRVSSADAIVEVSCIGYSSQTFTASQMPAKITISEDALFLDDVVVIGYGTVKKSDMTGSVSAVKADQLNKGVVSSPSALLQGKSAGVVITPGSGAPGSGSTIRIRGGSSLQASNDPLIVIDGLPVSNEGISGTADALSSINPNDIESFTVLKDASATAIYGSRASNGVILITTKKGNGSGKGVHLDIDFTASLNQNARFVNVMDATELREAVKQYAGAESDAYKALGDDESINTNWQKEIYRLAQTYELNASLSGKLDNKVVSMPYRFSIGGLYQQGTLKTGYMGRETVSLNLAPSFLDKHLTFNLNGKAMNMNTRFANTDAITQAIQYTPTKPVYDENGLNGYSWWNYGKGTFTVDNCNTMANQNPVALLNDKKDVSCANRFLGNAQIDYKIHGLEDLRLNLNLGIDYTNSDGTVDVAPNTEQSMHSTAQQEAGGNASGYHTNYSQKKLDQTLEFYADYSKTLGKHSFEVMAGYSWQHFYTESFNESFKANDTDPAAADYYLANPQTNKSEYYLVSFFGRANYSFGSRYYITGTLRRDGTSRFQNNKWGLFPSVALGWNIKNESFLSNSNTVSALKLRLSYGQTGQQDLNAGNYPTLATYVYNTNASQYIIGNQVIQPITPAGYNADLKWETTTTWNAGFDYGFLNDRIYGSVDFYKRFTKDLLNWTPVAAGANLTNYLNANIGNLENTGVEFEINAVAVETRDWNWKIGANVAWNKTVVTKLTTDDERSDYYGVETGGISGGTGNNIQVHQTGKAPYSFFVYQQVYDTDGNPIEGLYVDRNNDGKIDTNDKYCHHKAAPDVTIGLNTTLSYKNWTLALSAHSSIGNWVYDNIHSNGELLSDLWTNSFVNNRTSGALKTNFRTNAQYFSDYYVKNASFFKFDNITLSRYFALRPNSDRPMGLNVFATVQNVACISAYDGIDPEIYSGIDNNMYPRPRTYILGIKFNF
ncbi:MAG: SusC/RagA family TonB-linked outer membrane protein [Bacteroidales bacterium]|nr:SusC/RagA family TonB-linked outer membrane protein [Bacteroidales bacterium]